MSPRIPGLRAALLAGAGALALACSVAEETTPYALSSVVPVRGSIAGGTRVVLYGIGFADGATVLFGDAEATDVVVARATEAYVFDEITCTSPAHVAATVDVTVRNPDWTTITRPRSYVFEDVAPLIVAEHDRFVTPGARVDLDATMTVDPESAALSYGWTLIEAPEESTALLEGADAAPYRFVATPTTSFVADLAGPYRASLTVSDGVSTSGPVTVLVTTSVTASKVPDGGPDACWGASGRVHCPSVDEPGFGQDAHYLLNPSRLLVVGDTVEDGVTLLTWQRALAGRFNWYAASGTPHAEYNPGATDVCGSLVLGGQVDWRLPGVRELATLLRYGRGGPHLDLALFPAGAGASWSASQDSPDQYDVPYAVDFAVGVLTRGAVNRSTPLDVRCVRGPEWGVSALTDQGDGTVRDAGTGLEWQASPDGAARTWAEALAYCEGLSLGGSGPLHGDWRLPSASEAMTAVFPLGCALPGSRSAHYWTSTAEGPSPFALDCTRVGFTDTQPETAAHLVRCVR